MSLFVTQTEEKNTLTNSKINKQFLKTQNFSGQFSIHLPLDCATARTCDPSDHLKYCGKTV
jgi:hypothetical protein